MGENQCHEGQEGGSEFQSLGAERLKALLPIVTRRAEGTVRTTAATSLKNII